MRYLHAVMLVAVAATMTGCPFLLRPSYRFLGADLLTLSLIGDHDPLNNAGQIIGLLEPRTGVVSDGPTWVELEAPPSGSAVPQVINDDGVIAGRAEGTDEAYPAMWIDGELIPLDFGERRPAGIVGINNAGDVIANDSGLTKGDVYSGPVALLRRADGEVVELGPIAIGNPPVPTATFARDINNAGLVALQAVVETDPPVSIPMLWDGSFTTLPTDGSDAARIFALNDAGWAAGSVVVSRETDDEPVVNACVWIDGELIRLHRPGALESAAVDINSDGDVLTNETVLVDGETPQSTPVLWERDAHTGIYTPLDIRSEVLDIPDIEQKSLDGRALNDHQSMIITAVTIEPFKFEIYSVSWGVVN